MKLTLNSTFCAVWKLINILHFANILRAMSYFLVAIPAPPPHPVLGSGEKQTYRGLSLGNQKPHRMPPLNLLSSRMSESALYCTALCKAFP